MNLHREYFSSTIRLQGPLSTDWRRPGVRFNGVLKDSQCPETEAYLERATRALLLNPLLTLRAHLTNNRNKYEPFVLLRGAFMGQPLHLVL